MIGPPAERLYAVDPVGVATMRPSARKFETKTPETKEPETKKPETKRYFSHSMYPGGMRWRSLREVQASHPERVIRNAVRGMLPKNRLGRAMVKKLRVYRGSDHPHAAQRPTALEIS